MVHSKTRTSVQLGLLLGQSSDGGAGGVCVCGSGDGGFIDITSWPSPPRTPISKLDRKAIAACYINAIEKM